MDISPIGFQREVFGGPTYHVGALKIVVSDVGTVCRPRVELKLRVPSRWARGGV